MQAEPVTPFLKWPGGKRWLAPFLGRIIGDRSFNRYFEPFLGGGAAFFRLRLPNSVLSDINDDLINTYQQVRDNPGVLVERLRHLSVDADTFELIRRSRPRTNVERAIRFLYLNRTAFGGMYRLNRRGEFNVPFGGGSRKPDVLWERELIARAARALSAAELLSGDFEPIISRAQFGDLVYCDPTYTITHNNNGFRRYNECNFSWADQERLASVCVNLAKRGVAVAVSNAYHTDVARLYEDFEVHVVERRTSLCPKIAFRGKSCEYLFVANLYLKTEEVSEG